MPASDHHDHMSDNELDRLFSYNFGPEGDREEASIADASARNPNAARPTDGDDGLGIDREVPIGERKRRQPIAKLDSTLLTGPKGIPKLRSIAKKQLKFRGKGHEFSDTARLLNMYQLWLDELFPKAKFEDGLVMVEKLGHSKSVQSARKQWIDEERYGTSATRQNSTPPRNLSAQEDPPVSPKPNATDHASGNHATPSSLQNPNEPLERQQLPTSGITDHRAPDQPPNSDIPDDDELAALLAETTTGPGEHQTHGHSQSTAIHKPVSNGHDEYEAEMEAMADMDDLYG
ncbi:Swi3-domain-containing protein [Eremomyces bilateralis CBS 781.70]|uniref:Chromosome segregation in meiosis protein n=1 Tax=Eremomyces bilateralis CBS 781.70 TaxID=1392243 RepID=A0A6G1G4T2_9PEZI|nr:Swi3-domain-containing protein [Eremomyces bilateralis CBS 781.70]KAF1813073.1 Swi3-domain-containing protein [Eremomyces bilateralis CBS 781.70]